MSLAISGMNLFEHLDASGAIQALKERAVEGSFVPHPL